VKRKSVTGGPRSEARPKNRSNRDLEDVVKLDGGKEYEESPLHPNATTTHEMRREFQRSDESSRALARRYGLNEKTVSKHRRRITTNDGPMGRRSTAFTESEAELIERYRRFTYLNYRDCLKRLQPVIPQLNMGNLHRLLRRLGANRLPWGKTTSIERENAEARLGCFHVCVLHRRAEPRSAIVAFGEERGDVFAFYCHPSAAKTARFVTMLVARFPSLRLIVAPDDPLFGMPAHEGLRDEDAVRDRYTDHPFTLACNQSKIIRGHSELIFRPGPDVMV